MTTIKAVTRMGVTYELAGVTREHFRTTGGSSDDTFRGTLAVDGREEGRVVINSLVRQFDGETFDRILAEAHDIAPLDQDVTV